MLCRVRAEPLAGAEMSLSLQVHDVELLALATLNDPWHQRCKRKFGHPQCFVIGMFDFASK
eukprot:6191045-Pleurochrysis_carterae.AAC.2